MQISSVLQKQNTKGRKKDGGKDTRVEDEEGTKGGVSKRRKHPSGQDFTDGTDKVHYIAGSVINNDVMIQGHDRRKLSLHAQIGEREEDDKKERNIGDL